MKRLPATGGIKASTKKAIEFEYLLLEITEITEQAIRTLINTTKTMDKAILIMIVKHHYSKV